jgi:hypothetical protein
MGLVVAGISVGGGLYAGEFGREVGGRRADRGVA